MLGGLGIGDGEMGSSWAYMDIAVMVNRDLDGSGENSVVVVVNAVNVEQQKFECRILSIRTRVMKSLGGHSQWGERRGGQGNVISSTTRQCPLSDEKSLTKSQSLVIKTI